MFALFIIRQAKIQHRKVQKNNNSTPHNKLYDLRYHDCSNNGAYRYIYLNPSKYEG